MLLVRSRIDASMQHINLRLIDCRLFRSPKTGGFFTSVHFDVVRTMHQYLCATTKVPQVCSHSHAQLSALWKPAIYCGNGCGLLCVFGLANPCSSVFTRDTTGSLRYGYSNTARLRQVFGVRMLQQRSRIRPACICLHIHARFDDA